MLIITVLLSLFAAVALIVAAALFIGPVFSYYYDGWCAYWREKARVRYTKNVKR